MKSHWGRPLAIATAMQQPRVNYDIRVEGSVDQRWSGWFNAITIAYAENGDTILSCAMQDQAALYGVLMKLRDLGLTLVSVNRVLADSQKDATRQELGTDLSGVSKADKR